MENEREKQPIVTGTFTDREGVEKAYAKVHERGYTKDDVDLIMTDETRKKYFSKGQTEIGNKALEGTGTGSVIGGSIGAIAGVIAAIGTSLVIPGLGLVIAGPLAAGIAGAGAGGIAGGLIGALVGAGLTEERARLYEKDVKDGKILMNVHPKNAEDAKYFNSTFNVKETETHTE